MKILTKITFTVIVVIAAVSSTSCTVQYKSRHPHHEGNEHGSMVKPTILVDSTVVVLIQQIPVKKPLIVNDNKIKS
jgi:hypothetical protein